MKSCRGEQAGDRGRCPGPADGRHQREQRVFFIPAPMCPSKKLRATAVAMIDQGADMIDIGARSTGAERSGDQREDGGGTNRCRSYGT